MHRVYIPGASAPVATLPPDEAHHAIHVLRLDVGEVVVVFDGAGREWDARIATRSKSDVTVTLEAARIATAEPPVRVTLAIGLLKGDQMDAVIRDATMLGVHAIVPVWSAHVAVPKAARQTRGNDRWQRVAVASAKQCARAVVPAVIEARPLDAVLNEWSGRPMVVCVEPGRGAFSTAPSRPPTSDALLLVGPEGGWAPGEVEQAQRHGATLLTLGPRTLRAEVAPTVALTALWARWGWA